MKTRLGIVLLLAGAACTNARPEKSPPAPSADTVVVDTLLRIDTVGEKPVDTAEIKNLQ